jgi:ATP-dependent DNA ligase
LRISSTTRDAKGDPIWEEVCRAATSADPVFGGSFELLQSTLSERRHRSLARRLIAVRCAADARAERPPSGPGWFHEIKHDGFRMMVRRDSAGFRPLTRNEHDWSGRFPLIAEAAGALKLRSFLLDGEAVACDRDGLPSFERLRYRRGDGSVFLFAFDLLELNGDDLRREPLEVRKATLASVLAKAGSGLRLNEHLQHDDRPNPPKPVSGGASGLRHRQRRLRRAPKRSN